MAGFRSDENIYFSILKSFDGNGDRSLHYTQTFSRSIIPSARKYKLSVDRFNIPVTSIPIFIFNTLKNYYNLQIVYGRYDYGRVVTKIDPLTGNIVDDLRTEGSTTILFNSAVQPLLFEGSPINPSVNPYYNFIYSYDQFLKIINNALAIAYAQLVAQVKIIVPAIENSLKPYFELDQATNILSLMADPTYFTYSSSGNFCFIYFDNTMFRFMHGMPAFYKSGDQGGRNMLLQIFNKGNNIVTRNSISYIQMESEYGSETLIYWNDAKGLVMTSELVPSRTEQMPTSPNNSSDAPHRSILANFDFIYNAQNTKPLVAQYILQSPYKLIDLNTDIPINKFDINIYWVDYSNNFYPLFLFVNESWSMRFVFIKEE